MERVYNLKDTAELLGIKVTTVRAWIRRGKLSAKKLQGAKQWIVLESEIKRLRQEN